MTEKRTERSPDLSGSQSFLYKRRQRVANASERTSFRDSASDAVENQAQLQSTPRILEGIYDKEEFTRSEFGFLGNLLRRGYHVEIYIAPVGPSAVVTTISQILPYWPDFPYTSKVFRFASLAFCTAVFDRNDRRIFRYLERFHHYMNEAIDQKQLEEILFGSYAALMFYVQKGHGLRDICTFIEGICEAASLCQQELQTSAANATSLLTVDFVLFVSLETLRLAYFTSPDPLYGIDLELIRRISASLRKVSKWHGRTWPTVSALQLFKYDLYLKFYLDIFLVTMLHPESLEVLHATNALQGILRDIINLVPYFSQPWKVISIAMDDSLSWPWLSKDVMMRQELPEIRNFEFECWKTAFIYGLAKVLIDLLGQAQTEPNRDDISSPILLCRLYALTMSGTRWPWQWPCMARNLFWAGLALNKETDEPGNEERTKFLI